MMTNYAGERFLVAVPRAGSAESIIIDYGVGVMAIGGFKGSDNAISLDEFIALVEKGEIRYFWSSGNGRSDITQWAQDNGREVSQAEVLGQTSTASSGSGLYDLSPLEMEG